MIAFPKSYIGIPFVDTDTGGRNGTNCWGIVRLVYKEQKNMILPGYDDRYDGIDDLEGLDRVVNETIAESWRRVTKPEPFDAIITRWNGAMSHIGVVIDRRFFIHTRLGIDSGEEEYVSRIWRQRVVGFYRYVG